MHFHYNTNQTTIPLEISSFLPQDHLVFTIEKVVNTLEDCHFDAFYHSFGQPSYHPKMFVSTLLFSYLQEIFSGQEIANEEYTSYSETDPLKIKNDKRKKPIGTVRQVIEDETGLKALVVESPDRYLWYTISKSVHDIFVKYHKGDAMKILKIIGIVLASLLVIVGLSIGGFKVMKQVKHDEMVRIVKGEEVKKIIEDNLKLRHKGALEEGNIIQNYDIDINSIFHSPMGGIKFKIYINNDEELYVFFTINKDRSSGKLVNDGGGNSAKFEKMITEEKSE